MVFTLAARGYVLWIINVIFAVIAAKVWYRKRNKVRVSDLFPTFGSFLVCFRWWQAISPTSAPTQTGKSSLRCKACWEFWPLFRQVAPWHQQPQNTYEGLDNKGFRNDNDTLPMPRNDGLKQNYRNNDIYWNHQNGEFAEEMRAKWHVFGLADRTPPRSVTQPEAPSAYRQAPKTAKIGRQGGQRSPPLNVASPYIPDPDYSPPGSPKVRGVLRPRSNYEMY